MTAGGHMHFPRLPDWLVYAAAVMALLVACFGRQGRMDAPAHPSSPYPSVNAAGTAFSVDGSGRWVTAYHVVQGCGRVALMIEEGRAVLAQAAAYPDADLAVLVTEGGAPGLPVSDRRRLEEAEIGFHPGYPHGAPGEAVSRFLGRDWLPGRRRADADREVLAWTESGRTEEIATSLAGLSGAPVLDASGEVVGVTLAEQRRRGRIYTTTPQTLRRTLSGAGAASGGSELGQPITSENYYRVAERLRRELRIAPVICLPS